MSAEGGSSGNMAGSNTGGSGKTKQNTQGLSANDKAVMQAKGISLEGEKGQTVIDNSKGTSGGTPTQGPASHTEGAAGGESVPADIAPLFSLVQSFGGDVSGAMQQLQAGAQQSGLRGLAEGGDVAPGETVKVGEGGQPETVTAKPGGGATVTPSVTGVRAPASTSGLSQEQLNSVGAAPRTTGQVIHDLLVGAGLGPAGGAAYKANRNSAIAQRQQALVTLSAQNPQLLASSPLMAAAVDAYLGPNSSREILRQSAPEVHNAVIADQLNLNLPKTPDGGVRGEDFAPALKRGGYGFTVHGNGAFDVTFKPPTQTEIGAAAGWKMWTEGVEKLVQGGMPIGQAYGVASQETIQTMTRMGMVPPPEMRRVALAPTDINTEAAKTSASSAARLAQEQKYAAGIEQEKVLGRAGAEAVIPFQSVHIQGANGEDIQIPYSQAGAYAATGSTKAISLGKNPSKAQLDQAAVEGSDLATGPDGDLIKLPIGEKVNIPSVSAEAVQQGPEAVRQLTSLQETLKATQDPKFLRAFPSEKERGRITARGAGFWHSWTARFTDSPEVLNVRAELRKSGFRMARLLGSNSQLSDAERKSAEGAWEHVIDGTATREEVQAAYKSSSDWIKTIDTREKGGQSKAPKATEEATPDEALLERLTKAVENKSMTKEQAAAAYSAMTSSPAPAASPAP